MPRTPPDTRPRESYTRAAATSTAPADRRARARRSRTRPRRKRGRILLVLLMAVVAMSGGALVVSRGLTAEALAGVTATGASLAASVVPHSNGSPTPTVTASPQPVLALPGDYPKTGPGTWVYATTQGPLLGTAGTLRRFRVAVETGVPEDVPAFASFVDEVLGDPRSWIAGRTLRLQRVPAGAAADFTIYLATPGTAQRMCSAGGVDIRIDGVPYTSCRSTGRVIINLARWRESVPDYVKAKVPLDAYRRYVLNHEAGHEFGHGHELCPGPGRPAPVMQQQTLGLYGCAAYPWPYLDGRRYQGASGSYG